MEYFGVTKPKFEKFDLEESYKNVKLRQEIEQINQIRKYFAWFTDDRFFERNTNRMKITAIQLIERFRMYFDSWEYTEGLELINDF